MVFRGKHSFLRYIPLKLLVTYNVKNKWDRNLPLMEGAVWHPKFNWVWIKSRDCPYISKMTNSDK